MLKVYSSPSLQIHNPYTTPPGGVEEAHQRVISDLLARYLRFDGRFEVRQSKRSWRFLTDSDYLARVVADSNAWGANVHIANHSNAGGATADGTITYYGPQIGALELATALQKRVAPVSPGSDYGVVRKDDFAETHGPACPAALIELAFHSNKVEAISLVEHADAYALALARGIADYAGLTLRRSHPLTAGEKKRLAKKLRKVPRSQLLWLRRLINRLLRR